MGRLQQCDQVALDYERWIAPRYRVIADGLAAACRVLPDESVIEVAAGTGVMSRALAACGSVGELNVLSDISMGMLKVAREHVTNSGVARFVVSDCARLPLRSHSMNVALCCLGPLQDRVASIREVHRVLRRDGRIGIAMWGPRYSEVRLHNRVRKQVGLRPFPSADAAGAAHRLARCGFVDVQRRDARLEVHHESVDDYIRYRRSFGRPKPWSEETYVGYYERLIDELRRRFGDGPVILDWTITYLTAHVGVPGAAMPRPTT